MPGTATASATLRASLPILLDVPGPGKKTLKFARREFVYRQGDPADCIYLIRRGRVKISVTSPSGKEATVALLGEGEIFGARMFIGARRRQHNACAMSETEVLRVDEQTAMRLVRTDPRLAEAFLLYVLRRSSQTEEYLLYQLFENSERRLARVLLQLSNYGAAEGRQRPVRDVTHETLAQMVGTTRPRISSFLSKFRRLGYITISNGIQVNPSLVQVLLRDSEVS